MLVEGVCTYCNMPSQPPLHMGACKHAMCGVGPHPLWWALGAHTLAAVHHWQAGSLVNPWWPRPNGGSLESSLHKLSSNMLLSIFHTLGHHLTGTQSSPLKLCGLGQLANTPPHSKKHSSATTGRPVACYGSPESPLYRLSHDVLFDSMRPF
jgi:hypothetical protein